MRWFVIMMLFLLGTASAHAWQPHLSGDANAPQTLLAVDKKNQNFLIFSNRSPLRQEQAWQCTTGKVQGDKLVEGDFKTPEGVYFLEKMIYGEHLPFDLYGKMAFTLNYPNPVDRINQKTGHSIWIHGRGKKVIPNDTEGCVAMDMEYMLALENMVDLGKTPVIIADNLSWEPAETASENSRKIVEKSFQWAREWQRKSDKYFDYYDPVLFAESSGLDFNRFMTHKKKLFRQYPWMDVYTEKPRVIKGPDYWVSYFGQVFKAPGFYSVGVKRLYWKHSDKGVFKIVGEEWRSYPKDSLEQKYLATRKDELQKVINQWKKSWLRADIEEYSEFYYHNARQDNLKGLQAITAHKRDIWGRGLLPEAIDFGEIRISSTDQGYKAEFLQKYENRTGYSDYGLKTLIMIPFEGDWLIKSETWSEIS
ncbi:MAG: murein L,D-transpeptidase family protein [Desulfonatronovibrio sp.]